MAINLRSMEVFRVLLIRKTSSISHEYNLLNIHFCPRKKNRLVGYGTGTVETNSRNKLAALRDREAPAVFDTNLYFA